MPVDPRVEDFRLRIAKFPDELSKAAAIALSSFEGTGGVKLTFGQVELVIIHIELYLSNLCEEHKKVQPSCPADHINLSKSTS